MSIIIGKLLLLKLLFLENYIILTNIFISIVGVGSADFQAMNELDSDDGPLEQDGKKSVRDIVQFVSLRNYLRPDGVITNQGDLARDVLYEIPDQVESYFKLHGLKPGHKRGSYK